MSNNYDDYGYEDSNNDNSGLGKNINCCACFNCNILNSFFIEEL